MARPNLGALLVVAVAALLYRIIASPPALDRAAFLAAYGGGSALVTGAGRGIGKEFARTLGALGFDLVLVSRREDTLVPTAEEIRQEFGVNVRTVVARFGDTGAEEAVMAATAGTEISLFVNNHAATDMLHAEGGCNGTTRRYWVNEPLQSHLDQTSINYASLLKLTHHYARAQASRGKGGIILVSSSSAMKTMPFLAQCADGHCRLYFFAGCA
jgi:hypothetical protein